MVSQSWLSTVKSGLRLVIGSWKIAPMSRPGTMPAVRPVRVSTCARRCAMEPAAMRPGACSRPISGIADGGLAGAGFADEGMDLAGRDRQARRRSTAVTRRAVGERILDGEAPDVERRSPGV